MAKQDVLDAINATIADNNIKGITAQSLRNVLTMMTEVCGSGTGDGVLRIIVPMGLFGVVQELFDGEFTPAVWEAIKAEISTTAAGAAIVASLNDLVESVFAHNAEVYAKVAEMVAEGHMPAIVEDATPFMMWELELFAGTEGFENLADSAYGALLGISTVRYARVPSNGIDVIAIMSGDIHGLLSPDGGLEYRILPIEAYIPFDDYELSDEDKASNIRLVEWMSDNGFNLDAMSFYAPNSEGSGLELFGSPLIWDKNISGSELSFTTLWKLSVMRVVINGTDGSVTLTTLGTLNSPTTE